MLPDLTKNPYKYFIIGPIDTKIMFQYVFSPTPLLNAFWDTYSTVDLPNNYKDGFKVMSVLRGKIETKETHSVQFIGLRKIDNPIYFREIVVNPFKGNYLYDINLQHLDHIREITKKQRIGTKVYINEGSYASKIKGFLIGIGYEPINREYTIFQKENEQKAKYNYL